MDKYTVVIPTLRKSHRTDKLVNDLVDCKYVDEIIIIDNTQTKETDLMISEKVRLVSKGENLYVNPSWNWGIEIAKNECVALCNDDINFDPSIFGIITEDVLVHNGIIGMGEGNYKDLTDEEQTPYIDVWQSHINDWGWGCMILLRKSDWKPIPSEIKIWYGDNFIKELNPVPKGCLRNFRIQTEMSTTSDSTEWDEIKERDYAHFTVYKILTLWKNYQ